TCGCPCLWLRWRFLPGPSERFAGGASETDRKSTRLNSSHVASSYAVFCLKKKDSGGFHPTCKPAGSRPFPTSGHSEWNGARRFPCPIKLCSSAWELGKKFPRGMKRKRNLFRRQRRRSH